MPEINNVKPFDKIEVKVEYFQQVEGEHTIADDILLHKIPENLEGIVLELVYLNEQRTPYITLVKIRENKLINILK